MPGWCPGPGGSGTPRWNAGLLCPARHTMAAPTSGPARALQSRCAWLDLCSVMRACCRHPFLDVGRQLSLFSVCMCCNMSCCCVLCKVHVIHWKGGRPITPPMHSLVEGLTGSSGRRVVRRQPRCTRVGLRRPRWVQRPPSAPPGTVPCPRSMCHGRRRGRRCRSTSPTAMHTFAVSDAPRVPVSVGAVACIRP